MQICSQQMKQYEPSFPTASEAVKVFPEEIKRSENLAVG